MIRVAITAEVFEAIAATLPPDSMGYEHTRTAHGGYFIWLDQRTVERLKAARQPGESYSDVILRIAGR